MNGQCLRAIAVHNVQHLFRLNVRVNGEVFRHERLAAFESVCEKRTDHDLIGQLAVCRPVLGIEIPVHQKFCE